MLKTDSKLLNTSLTKEIKSQIFYRYCTSD